MSAHFFVCDYVIGEILIVMFYCFIENVFSIIIQQMLKSFENELFWIIVIHGIFMNCQVFIDDLRGRHEI